jgi:hypothetical protein
MSKKKKYLLLLEIKPNLPLSNCVSGWVYSIWTKSLFTTFAFLVSWCIEFSRPQYRNNKNNNLIIILFLKKFSIEIKVEIYIAVIKVMIIEGGKAA